MALKFKYNKADLTAEVCGIDEGDTIAHIPDTVEYYRKKYTVTKIGDSAFSGCTSLLYVTIPDGVTIIEEDAFRGCSGLKEISIPSSVGIIRCRAFADGILRRIYGPDLTLKCGLEVANIYNDEGYVLIYPDAFNKSTKVNYLGKKQAKSSSTTSV